MYVDLPRDVYGSYPVPINPIWNVSTYRAGDTWMGWQLGLSLLTRCGGSFFFFSFFDQPLQYLSSTPRRRRRHAPSSPHPTTNP